MNKETKIIVGIGTIVVVIIILVILYYLIGILLYIFLFIFISSPIIVVIVKLAREQLRNEKIKMMENEGKYIICPKCKEIVDIETGICPSCGYKV